MSTKRALFVTTEPSMIQRFLLPFADYFRQQGWKVDGMAADIGLFPEVVRHFHQVWHISFSRHPFSPSNFLQAPSQIRRIIQQQRYAIVHVHSPVAAFITRYVVKSLPKLQRPKIIYTAHGFHFHGKRNFFSNTFFYLLEKTAGRWTDSLVVINPEDLLISKKKKIVPRKKLVYMPGIGIDLCYYHKDRVHAQDIQAFRNEIGAQEGDPIFLMIAEFIERKQQKLALEAFIDLANDRAHLVFVGAGRCFNDIEQKVKTRGLSHRIHLLGFRNDIPVLISSALATLLVSKHEGLPRAVLESLSLEVPVIGTNVRGIHDLLRKGGGILISDGDKASLTRAMNQLIMQPEEAALLGRQGRKVIVKYALLNIIKHYDKLYHQLYAEFEQQTLSTVEGVGT